MAMINNELKKEKDFMKKKQEASIENKKSNVLSTFLFSNSWNNALVLFFEMLCNATILLSKFFTMTVRLHS